MNVKNLEESQLLALYQKKVDLRNAIEGEWLRRYAVPYPYTLDIRGNIVSAETHKIIDDNLAPDDVFHAAESLRDRRAQGG